MSDLLVSPFILPDRYVVVVPPLFLSFFLSTAGQPFSCNNRMVQESELTLEGFLAKARLAAYEEQLRGLGVETPEDLLDLEDDDLEAMGMRKLEIKRLKKESKVPSDATTGVQPAVAQPTLKPVVVQPAVAQPTVIVGQGLRFPFPSKEKRLHIAASICIGMSFFLSIGGVAGEYFTATRTIEYYTSTTYRTRKAKLTAYGDRFKVCDYFGYNSGCEEHNWVGGSTQDFGHWTVGIHCSISFGCMIIAMVCLFAATVSSIVSLASPDTCAGTICCKRPCCIATHTMFSWFAFIFSITAIINMSMGMTTDNMESLWYDIAPGGGMICTIFVILLTFASGIMTCMTCCASRKDKSQPEAQVVAVAQPAAGVEMA